MRFLSRLVERIRRNHALEHATINVLTESHPGLQLMGRTTPWGFYVYGPVGMVELANAVSAALARLRAGERHLAVHPSCGTNLAVEGVLAGLAAFAALRGQRRLGRLPQALAAATLAVLAARPLGRWAQANLTTSTEVGGVEIRGISRRDRGGLIVHWVELGHE